MIKFCRSLVGEYGESALYNFRWRLAPFHREKWSVFCNLVEDLTNLWNFSIKESIWGMNNLEAIMKFL